jgi:Met-zincin/Domain of unknown function (DUF5117)
MIRTRERSPVALLAALVLGVPTWAYFTSPVAAEEPKNAAATTSEQKPKPPDKKPDFPPFDEVSEDHVKIPGFFDLYYNKTKDHMLAVIPKSMIGKDFLILSSISGGPGLAGYMWDGYVAHWKEVDKKLVLIEPDLQYDRAANSTVKDVVARTYTDRIIASTKIVSKRGSDPVIDLDSLLKKDLAGIGAVYGGSMNSSLSRWAKHKGFEKNVELAVDAAIMKGKRGMRARVHYSVSELPKNDYKPRRADERIGYFMTAIKNWGRDHNDKTVFDRYVHRWHLRKSDPKAKVSDVHPDDQIIFYMEKTVPVKYRRYVREGILSWNAAFEKIGLLNAVEVRQQTDTNEFKDLDPEDVRYNFFRWIVSGRAFAMGPSRVNPKTGQILDADILWDDALLRSLMSQYARLSAKGPSTSYDPQLDEFLTRFPEWGFTTQEETILPNTTQYGGMQLTWEPGVLRKLIERNPDMCTCAQGMTHEMGLANLVFTASGAEGLSEEFIGQAIRYIVAHEVGHTLGLRHNFKASTWKPIGEIAESREANVITSGSVMDYIPPVYGDTPDDQPNFYSAGVGPYDEWAIEYGYRPTDSDSGSEKEMLSAIASRCNEPGLAYATDEDRRTFAPDPMVNVYDNGDDLVEFARRRMKLVQKLQSNVADWSVEDGESYSSLRKAFDGLLFEYGRVARLAARMIGGQYVYRNYKGDADERPNFVIVPVAKQREALDFLIETVFADDAFTFDPQLLNKLGPGRWGHWSSDDYDSSIDYPVHDRIAAAQYWAIFHVLNPFTLSRIYDAELKIPAEKEAITIPEVMAKTTRAIWSELTKPVGGAKHSNRNPFISSIRRSLQRQHLRTMLNIVLSRPGGMVPADAHAVARTTLKGLSQQIGTVLKGGSQSLDPMTHAHLDEVKARIDKGLDADFKLRS